MERIVINPPYFSINMVILDCKTMTSSHGFHSIFLLLCCFILSSHSFNNNYFPTLPHENNDPITIIAPGVIFDPLENTKFILGFMDLHVDMRCSKDIADHIQHIHEEIKHTYTFVLPFLESKIPLENSTTSLTRPNLLHKTTVDVSAEIDIMKSHISITNKHAEFLLSQLESLLNDPWIVHHRAKQTNSKIRFKRGLLDAGGYALKAIFGSAMDRDVKTLQHQVELLSENNEITTSLFTKYTTQLKTNTEQLRTMTDSINKIQAITKEISHQFSFLNNIALINSFFNFSQIYLHNILHIKYLVSESLSYAHRHVTPHALYSYEFMHDLLSEKVQIEHLTTAVDLNTLNFRSFMTATWSVEGDLPHTLTTLIPFTSPNKYETYHVLPFPTPSKNSSRIILDPTHDLFFISKQLMKFTYISDSQFTKCMHLRNGTICPLFNPLSTFSIPNCELYLFTNNSFLSKTQIPTHCNMITYSPISPFTAHVQKYTVISFFENTDARIQCNNPYMTKDIQVKDIFILNPGCSLTTNTQTFHNPYHIDKSVILPTMNANGIPFLSTYLNHSFSNLNLPNLTKVTWDSKLDNLTNSLSIHNTHITYLHWVSYSAVSIAAIGILCLLCFIISCVYRKCTRNSTGVITQPSLSVPMISVPTVHSPLRYIDEQTTNENFIPRLPLTSRTATVLQRDAPPNTNFRPPGQRLLNNATHSRLARFAQNARNSFRRNQAPTLANTPANRQVVQPDSFLYDYYPPSITQSAIV